MNKEHIIAEIIRTADENNGKPLGKKRFAKETGIRESDWCGVFWARWSEAIKEAGFEPNIMNKAFPDDFIISKLIALIQELKTFPTMPELRLKRREDKNFPSHNVISRLGKKHEIAAKIIEYCEREEGFKEVIDICRPLCLTLPPNSGIVTQDNDQKFGFVYLMKSGHYYKIGKSSSSVERRMYDIGIKLPENLELIHKIRTDDPSGIEDYWHRRFKDKRKKGEWFVLSSTDVKAFKRRKFM